MYTRRKGPGRGYKTFVRELKAGELKNVALLYGPEQFQVRWAAGLLKKNSVNPAAEAIDAAFPEEGASCGDIIAACQTFAMMSPKRYVEVRSFAPLLSAAKAPAGYTSADIEALIDYIQSPNPRTLLVFTAEEINGKSALVKALKKYGSWFEFGQMERRELMNFANKRFRMAGKTISSSDMRYLIDSTGYYNPESGYRLDRFESDLQKIIAHSASEQITRDDIDLTVDGEGDAFIFDLLDSISENNKSRAFEILHNRLGSDSREALSIAGSIVSQMEVMLEVREFMESPEGQMTPAQIHKRTGLNEYRIKKTMRYARRYPLAKLRRMLSDSYRVNVDIVSGLLDPRMALEMYIAKI